MGIQTDFYL